MNRYLTLVLFIFAMLSCKSTGKTKTNFAVTYTVSDITVVKRYSIKYMGTTIPEGNVVTVLLDSVMEDYTNLNRGDLINVYWTGGTEKYYYGEGTMYTCVLDSAGNIPFKAVFRSVIEDEEKLKWFLISKIDTTGFETDPPFDTSKSKYITAAEYYELVKNKPFRSLK